MILPMIKRPVEKPSTGRRPGAPETRAGFRAVIFAVGQP
jgi:hypothetical protein